MAGRHTIGKLVSRIDALEDRLNVRPVAWIWYGDDLTPEAAIARYVERYPHMRDARFVLKEWADPSDAVIADQADPPDDSAAIELAADLRDRLGNVPPERLQERLQELIDGKR
jgi:hypothetical protein